LPHNQLVYAEISESELTRIMNRVGKSVEGERTSDVIAGCIAVALAASNNDITIDEVLGKIQPISELISMHATDTESAINSGTRH
jgi:ribosomal protein L12E/L44/L45/RPP1/RPP2